MSEESSSNVGLVKGEHRDGNCETGHDHFSSDFIYRSFIFLSNLTLFVVEMSFLFNTRITETRKGK